MTVTEAYSVQKLKGHLLFHIIISYQKQFTGVLFKSASETSSSTSSQYALVHLHFRFSVDVSDAFFPQAQWAWYVF